MGKRVPTIEQQVFFSESLRSAAALITQVREEAAKLMLVDPAILHLVIGPCNVPPRRTSRALRD